jgi:hypothetical protein
MSSAPHACVRGLRTFNGLFVEGAPRPSRLAQLGMRQHTEAHVDGLRCFGLVDDRLIRIRAAAVYLRKLFKTLEHERLVVCPERAWDREQYLLSRLDSDALRGKQAKVHARFARRAIRGVFLVRVDFDAAEVDVRLPGHGVLPKPNGVFLHAERGVQLMVYVVR